MGNEKTVISRWEDPYGEVVTCPLVYRSQGQTRGVTCRSDGENTMYHPEFLDF